MTGPKPGIRTSCSWSILEPDPSERRTRAWEEKRHSEEQIVRAMKEVEAGETVANVCRKLGVAQATFYTWKKQFAGMGVQELH